MSVLRGKDQGASDSLLYRQFRESPTSQVNAYTVVVNLWDTEIGGVPAEDAMCYYGLHSTFPQPDSLLIFDHWSEKVRRLGDAPAQRETTDLRGRGFNRAIQFMLPDARHVSLTLHDVSGRKVRTLLKERCPAGPHSIDWDGLDDAGRRMESGVYFYRLTAGDIRAGHRVVILK